MSSPESDDDVESDLNISVGSLPLSIASLFQDTDNDFSEHSNTSASEDEACSNHDWTDDEDSPDSESVSSECDSPPAKKNNYHVIHLCH
jgi:hypothetical protein